MTDELDVRQEGRSRPQVTAPSGAQTPPVQKDGKVPYYPWEGQEIGSTIGIALVVERVKRIQIPVPTPDDPTATQSGFETVFTITASRDGAPLDGLDVKVAEVGVLNASGGEVTGKTGRDGKFTGSIRGAVTDITFRVDAPDFTNYVRGEGTLVYKVAGTPGVPAADQITLQATVMLTTRGVRVSSSPKVEFSMGDDAPFVGVDAQIKRPLSVPKRGVTDDEGKFPGPFASPTELRIDWIDSSGKPQTRLSAVP
jgi:hypothetical protein